MNRPLAIGVAGLGAMGRVHAANLAGRIPGAALARVVDPIHAVARAAGEQFGVPWSMRYDDLLTDEHVRAVVIAAPTPLHAEMVEQAAAAGKHVFCEKPLALKLEPSVRCVESTRSAGVLLQVGFHRRFDPDFLAAHERIEAGELGAIYLFRTSARDRSTDPDPTALAAFGHFCVDATIHDLDLARWLVGEITDITVIGAALSDPAFAAAGDIDHCVVTLRFASGALGIIDNSRVAGYGFECSTEIVGAHATLRVGTDHRANQLQWLSPGTLITQLVGDHTERHPVAYRRELEHFAAAVQNQRPPVATGEDALVAFTLAQAAAHAHQTGRTIHLPSRTAAHAPSAPTEVPSHGST
jgi:myo-inositol 2-dehydrogenase/D-chiro-inositol 1-dehydrogenase